VLRAVSISTRSGSISGQASSRTACRSEGSRWGSRATAPVGQNLQLSARRICCVKMPHRIPMTDTPSLGPSHHPSYRRSTSRRSRSRATNAASNALQTSATETTHGRSDLLLLRPQCAPGRHGRSAAQEACVASGCACRCRPCDRNHRARRIRQCSGRRETAGDESSSAPRISRSRSHRRSPYGSDRSSAPRSGAVSGRPRQARRSCIRRQTVDAQISGPH
jgi:hypothetical protein